MTTEATSGSLPTTEAVTAPVPAAKGSVDLTRYVIEDGEPIENFFAEKQYRLLTHPLYACWAGPGPGRSFLVASNVGLFGAPEQLQALCPDVMLAVDVRLEDVTLLANRSWFVWERGKAPDVVLEIVSDRRGGEGDRKSDEYARIGIPYYVIFDPLDRLRGGVLRSFELRQGVYVALAEDRYPLVGLGLVPWRGQFEGTRSEWIRWCDLNGQLIPTPVERAEQAEERANNAQLDRDRLAAQLRALGIEPDA